MEVKVGYKQTEIGIIPNDWDLKTVNDLVNISILHKPLDGNHGNIHPKSSDFVKDGIPFIMANNVQNGKVDFINCNFIKKEQADNLQKGFSINGDVLFTHKGTVGNIAIVENITTEYIMLTPQVTYYRVKDNQKLSNSYIKQFFEGDFFQKYVENISGGGTRAYIGITGQRQLPFILPPINEQIAIADALSDTDAWISSLEQLLTKKCQIKQGTMQELLLPKEGWEVKSLGETFDVLADYTANGSFETLKNNVRYYSQTNYSVLVRTTDLDKKVFEPERFTDKQGYDFLSKTSLFGGELIIANVGSIGKVFKVPFYNMKMTLAPNTYMIKFNKKTSQEFIYQWMLTEEFRTKLMAKVGSTTLLAINKDNLRDIILNIPKDIKEQTRIATILSDMDEEIAQIETKLAKAKQIKQGMMQELLTGRIRLV